MNAPSPQGRNLPAKQAWPRLPFATMSVRGKHVSIVLAVAVHLALLIFLFYGVNWQSQPSSSVEVDLVRAGPPSPAPAAAPMSPPSAPPTPIPPPKPASAPLPEPKVEAKPPVKPDIAIKEKDKVPPKPLLPAQSEPREDPNRKLIEQELKQLEAQRKATELANAAAQELANVKAAQASAARSKFKSAYEDKIRGKIKGNIVLPPDIQGNPEAEFDVVQIASGEIISVKLRKSSGHPGYDGAVERAILKSSPLPKPDAAELFSRELRLKFRPQEE